MVPRQVLVAIFLLVGRTGGHFGAQTTLAGIKETGQPTLNVKKAPVESTLPSVFDLLRTRYLFEKDGTGHKEVIANIRILNEMGTLQQSEQAFEYHPLSEELQIPYIRVKKSGGTVVNIATNVIQTIPTGVTADTDLDERRVRIPGLEVGDQIEYDVVTVIHRPLGPGQFCVQHSFVPSGVFVEQLEVDVPRGREVKLKNISEGKFWKTVEGARTIFHWTSQNPEAARVIDVPYVPGRTPDVQVSSFEKWEEVGRWYSDLERNQRKPTAEIKAKADELTKGSKDDLEKIEALYNFAAKRIKYVSLVSLGIGGSEPHSASETLHKGYGDCKDKTALLEALLEAEGMHASSVLISADRQVYPDFPTPWPFDHVILVLRVGDEEVWMDPSSPVLPFRMLAYTLRGKRALLISSRRVSYLSKTPLEAPIPSTWSEEIEGKVAADGTLDALIKITARGDAEVLLRNALISPGGSLRPWAIEGVVVGINRSDKISDVKVSDPLITNEAFLLTFQMSRPLFIQRSDTLSTIKLPFTDASSSTVKSCSIKGSTSKEPLSVRLGPPGICRYRITIEFAQHLVAYSSPPFVIHSDFASYSAKYALENNVLTANYELITYMDELPASLIKTYQDFERQIVEQSNVTVAHGF